MAASPLVSTVTTEKTKQIGSYRNKRNAAGQNSNPIEKILIAEFGLDRDLNEKHDRQNHGKQEVNNDSHGVLLWV